MPRKTVEKKREYKRKETRGIEKKVTRENSRKEKRLES